MEKIELTKDQLKDLLHTATGNVKDFVTDNDGFIKEWLDKQLILHPVSGCIRTDNFGEVVEASGNDPCLECKFKDLSAWSVQCGHCLDENETNQCYR